MKTNPPKLNQLSPGECQGKAPFTRTALALAFVSLSSTVLPVQSVQAQGANVLEEVIVTARKREEPLQDIPVAVSVVTADAINRARIENMADLSTIVPGLVTTESTASTSGLIFLRGVGSGSLSPLIDQAVSINIDGVGISSAALMNVGMFDLDRIEVLRGPQALFYGKNSPGGVIAIHTKDPTDEFELELSALYETEGEEPMVRGIVSGPLGETLKGRLSVGWSDADNNRFDVQNFDVFEDGPGGVPVQTAVGTDENPVSTERISAMGTLVWEPTDALSAKLKATYMEHNQDGHTNYNFQRTQCGQGDPQVIYPVPGVNNCKLDEDVQTGGVNPALLAIDPNAPGYAGEGFADDDETLVSLEVNYEISDTLDLTSVTGYYDNEIERVGDSSFEVASTLANTSGGEIEQWSQEFRLRSNYDGAFNFVAGAYYEDKQIDQYNAVTLSSFNPAVGAPVGLVGLFPIPIGQQFSSQDGTAYSAFTELIWDFNDQWTLSVGGRYSYEEKEVTLDVNYFDATPGGGPKIGVPLADDKPDWDNLSPEVTLSYRYNDDIMFFASYKEGFKSGGIDAAWKPGTLLAENVLTGIPYDGEYDEEEVDGFEAGMKSTLLDSTLRFNATLYYYEYDGLQLTKLDFSDSGVPVIRVQNAASATVQGLELETVWAAPVDGLTLTANVAYNDAEYDDYVADCFNGQTIAQGCSENLDTDTGRFTGADMSGESLPNASDWSATFAVDYFVSVGSNWNMGFNVTSSYKDDYNPTSSMFPDSWWQESYWLTNASVSLYSSDDTWEFFVRGINLGDEYYSSTGSTLGGDAGLSGTNDPSGQPDFFQFVNGGSQYIMGVTYRM